MLRMMFWILLSIGLPTPHDSIFAKGPAPHRVVRQFTVKLLHPTRPHADSNPAQKPASKTLDWPDNRGFLGEPKRQTLSPGTRVDRYGHDGGTFVSPEGTPFAERALPASYETTKPYRVFQVLKPLTVKAGPAAPWFGQKGMGTQYELDHPVAVALTQKYLKDVTP